MSNLVRSLIVISCLVFFSGCAHVISNDLRNKVDPSLTFEKVIKDPIAYKGKTVVWGGEIVETFNQKMEQLKSRSSKYLWVRGLMHQKHQMLQRAGF
jgi:Outer membrane lipoprotein Slp family.